MSSPFKILGTILIFLVSNVQNECIYSSEISRNINANLPFEIDFYIPIKWTDESLNIDIGDNKLKLSNSEWHQSNENEEIIHINDTYVKLGWNKIIVVAANQNSVKISDISGNIWIDKRNQTIQPQHKFNIRIVGLFSLLNCSSDKRTFRMTTKDFTIPLIFEKRISFMSFFITPVGQFQRTPPFFSLRAKFAQHILSACPSFKYGIDLFLFNETCSSRSNFRYYKVYDNYFLPDQLFQKIEYVEIGKFSYAQIEIEIENFSTISLTIETSSYGNERAPLQLHLFSSLKNHRFNDTQVALKSDKGGTWTIIIACCSSVVIIALIVGAALHLKKRRKSRKMVLSKEDFETWPELADTLVKAVPREANMVQKDNEQIKETSSLPSTSKKMDKEYEDYHECKEDQNGDEKGKTLFDPMRLIPSTSQIQTT